MRLSQETDYAVRMVVVLAGAHAQGADAMGASAIGEQACIPRPTALKVLRMLKDSGIVRSTMGAGGGYRLARDPESIDLRQVIEAIEGKIEISRCLCPEYECSRTGKKHERCRFHKVYKRLNDKLVGELEKVTFGCAQSGED